MVNQFLNPTFISKAVKGYFFDVNRLWRVSEDELKNVQDNSIKKITKYAYNIPIYKKKFIEKGINPKQFLGIEEISKLPFISKEDIRKEFPKGVIPEKKSKSQFWELHTSGSTGKPCYFYRDTYGLFRDYISAIRTIKLFDINWKKNRILFSSSSSLPGNYATVGGKAIMKNLTSLFSLKNIKNMYGVSKDSNEKIQEINRFMPNYIYGFPQDMQLLAYIKKNGYLENVNPKLISTSGSILDSYSRSYIEEAFQCTVADMYGSVEMSTMACQCNEGNYHIFSDFLFLEFLDENNSPVSFGEPGNVIATRFFGGGTPFIRYTGLDDIATPIDEKCSCGLNTPLIKKIKGRISDCIILPNGKYLTPAILIIGIHNAIEKIKTDKVKQFQIIQKSIHEVEILIVIDENQIDKPPSIEKLFKNIEQEYNILFENLIDIKIKSVKNVIKENKTYKPAPLIISKINNKIDKML